MSNTSDGRLDRRRSSSSLGTDTSPRPSSLPPTPPSASDVIHADRVTLAAPLQPFLMPPTPPDSSSAMRASSPVPLSRTGSFSRLLGRDNIASQNKVEQKQDESDETDNVPHVPDPIEELLLADMPPLPTPRSSDSCPIFCCFYAEFDIVKGPIVAFQSPMHFMDQDAGISIEEIHEMLQETFQRVKIENEAKESDDTEQNNNPDEKPNDDSGGTRATTADDDQEPLLSIFDATSEYIITGNELAGKMINLSTRNMHILTRPTAISDERYARNALLFSVGFVLSRKEDPRPFRPLLCKWADALRSMEVENYFLTDANLRVKLQPMLDRLLVSLNSTQWECNLLLDPANALNVRAFRPPKPPAPPVPDYAVPILVRGDLMDLYEWDLAIKWISWFISGVDHARWIAIKSNVDMEMVRACLRVLKHHGVIALADMFFYSNRYEFTERATAMLAGKEPKLLQEAMEYIPHLHLRSNSNTPPLGEASPALAVPSLSSSVGRHADGVPFLSLNPDVMSFPPRKGSGASHAHVGSLPSGREVPKSHASRHQQKKMRMALAELYCSCNRNTSFGDLMVSTVASSSSVSMMRRGSSKASTSGGIDLDDIQESLGEDRVVRLSSVESDSSVKKIVSPCESSISERAKPGVEESVIDWAEVFEFFDHRRFATFGVVHGLLRRIHNFPRAIETTNGGTDKSLSQRRASSRSNGSQKVAGDSVTTASRVARMMDGTRCDDELVCEFERPLDELVELVEGTKGGKVFSAYSVE